MKKNISRNPLWPDWYNGKKIDEVQFGRAFLEQWPLKCVNGTLYTLDGPVEDESEIKQRILENIEEYVTSGLSKKVTNILETIKLLAFSDPFPIEQDCIHLRNGVYHLPDGSFQESRLFCQNRLPVKYDPKAASPDRWLTFLHELLDDADIPTLQEYLGYCLIPSTKGQKMMLIVGKGGEGKSRIGLVLKRLMGDAASNGSVQKVENNRFARADLERRLLMIDDDMDMNALPKTNYIKTIVTAEAKLDLERKGVQSYQRDIYARFLCFGNGALTSLYDHSDGFFRRQLILTTKDKPADRTDDPFPGGEDVRRVGGHPAVVSGRATPAGAEQLPLHGQRTSRRQRGHHQAQQQQCHRLHGIRGLLPLQGGLLHQFQGVLRHLQAVVRGQRLPQRIGHPFQRRTAPE